MVSTLGYMKDRILQVYFEKGRLVILKSKLYDFSTPESCDQNLGLFMLYLASDCVGDTKVVNTEWVTKLME